MAGRLFVTIGLSPEQKELVKRRADQAGLPEAAYARDRLLGEKGARVYECELWAIEGKDGQLVTDGDVLPLTYVMKKEAEVDVHEDEGEHVVRVCFTATRVSEEE